MAAPVMEALSTGIRPPSGPVRGTGTPSHRWWTGACTGTVEEEARRCVARVDGRWGGRGAGEAEP